MSNKDIHIETLQGLIKISSDKIKQLEGENLKLRLEATKHKAIIKYIKEEVIPPNYPYRSNCSSPFCKFITALRMHGLD
jgi:hypothetical protein